MRKQIARVVEVVAGQWLFFLGKLERAPQIKDAKFFEVAYLAGLRRLRLVFFFVAVGSVLGLVTTGGFGGAGGGGGANSFCTPAMTTAP